ncbi:hypothetical protein Tco_0451136 [Tanacetum coccineum]
MLVYYTSTSPSKITSSPSPTPSPSPEPTPTQPSPTQPSPTQQSPTQPSPTQPSPTQPSPTQLSPTQPGIEHHPPTPHDSPLHVVHSHGSDEGSLKLQELMNLLTILLTGWGQEARGSDKGWKQGDRLGFSLDTEVKCSTKVIQDQEGSEKASDEVSTTGAKKDTASEEVPTVSTAKVHLSTARGTVTYSRRSAEKRSRQDKGKSIMIEEEPKKKSKKELEQERKLKQDVKEPAAKRKKSFLVKHKDETKASKADDEIDKLKGFLDIESSEEEEELNNFIQNENDDLKDNHSFRGGLLGINLHMGLYTANSTKEVSTASIKLELPMLLNIASRRSLYC